MLRKYQSIERILFNLHFARMTTPSQKGQDGYGKSAYDKAQDKASDAWQKVKETGTTMGEDLKKTANLNQES